MSTTETPTPHAAILDRITEAEVSEWMQARLAKANADYPHEVACINVCAWSGRSEWTAHGLVNGDIHGIGHRKASPSHALSALADDIAATPSKAEQKRQQAAALIADAEALEAEGTQ